MQVAFRTLEKETPFLEWLLSFIKEFGTLALSLCKVQQSNKSLQANNI
jgi:hypothetical protein